MTAFLQRERVCLKQHNPPSRNPPYDDPIQYESSPLMQHADQREKEQMTFVLTDPSVSLLIGAQLHAHISKPLVNVNVFSMSDPMQ